MTTPVARITSAQYVEEDANYCPVCGSDGINYGDLNTDTGVITQEMDCSACEVEWYGVFRLAGFEPRLRTWPERAWSFEHLPEPTP